MFKTKSFAAHLVAVTSLFGGLDVVVGQMPRECFYVTEMHGPQIKGTDLISDLPALTSMFKLGMKMQSVIGLQDADVEDILTGLQINLYNTE
jgi:hypothetical protein